MERWSADFTNDPFDDYNLIVEILLDGEDVAAIKRGINGLEITYYPNKDELHIPFDWIFGLFQEAKKRFDDFTKLTLEESELLEESKKDFINGNT